MTALIIEAWPYLLTVIFMSVPGLIGRVSKKRQL